MPNLIFRMLRLFQMGLIGLATSRNATEGNVKAKMEEYDRNLVLKSLDFYSEAGAPGLENPDISKPTLRKVIPLYANHLGWLSFRCTLIG